MKPSLEMLIALQKEYDVLSEIEALLQLHIDRISDWSDGAELAEHLEQVKEKTFQRMCDIHDEANKMARKLKLHRPSRN